MWPIAQELDAKSLTHLFEPEEDTDLDGRALISQVKLIVSYAKVTTYFTVNLVLKDSQGGV